MLMHAKGCVTTSAHMGVFASMLTVHRLEDIITNNKTPYPPLQGLHRCAGCWLFDYETKVATASY